MSELTDRINEELHKSLTQVISFYSSISMTQGCMKDDEASAFSVDVKGIDKEEFTSLMDYRGKTRLSDELIPDATGAATLVDKLMPTKKMVDSRLQHWHDVLKEKGAENVLETRQALAEYDDYRVPLGPDIFKTLTMLSRLEEEGKIDHEGHSLELFIDVLNIDHLEINYSPERLRESGARNFRIKKSLEALESISDESLYSQEPRVQGEGVIMKFLNGDLTESKLKARLSSLENVTSDVQETHIPDRFVSANGPSLAQYARQEFGINSAVYNKHSPSLSTMEKIKETLSSYLGEGYKEVVRQNPELLCRRSLSEYVDKLHQLVGMLHVLGKSTSSYDAEDIASKDKVEARIEELKDQTFAFEDPDYNFLYQDLAVGKLWEQVRTDPFAGAYISRTDSSELYELNDNPGNMFMVEMEGNTLLYQIEMQNKQLMIRPLDFTDKATLSEFYSPA